MKIIASLTKTHLFLVLGLTVFTALSYFIGSIKKFDFGLSHLALNFEFLVPVVCALTIGVAHWLYSKTIKKIKSSDSNPNLKLKNYRSAQLKLWKMYVSAALWGIIAHAATGVQNLILYACIVVVLLFYFRPLASRAIEEIGISKDELDAE